MNRIDPASMAANATRPTIRGQLRDAGEDFSAFDRVVDGGAGVAG